MTFAEYYGRELDRLDDTSEFYRVKVVSDKGETRWLNMTPEMLSEFRELMTKERSE